MAGSFSLSLFVGVFIATTGLRLISAAEIPPPILPPSLPPPPPPFFTTHIPPPPPVSTTHAPPPPSVSTSDTPPPPADEIQQNQLNNIIDALIGEGNFTAWAGLLSFTYPSFPPPNATFFIPSNDAISRFPATGAAAINFDPFLIPYHIVPQRLTFSDLQQFTTHTRLPTLLPYKSIVITNNSPSNFTVDDSQITQADIVVNAAFSVHGVKKILEYSVYGGDGFLSLPPGNSHSSRRKRRRGPPRKRKPNSPGESTLGPTSGVSSSWGEVLMISSTSFVVFVLNIL
ncbi:hypothetical protein CDL12_30010 [Handroanthus impetiginosus]|uniref:FAS1 domain-containing protein n=1 Tax=Handroanthus impetiginosus TaxID=429701 RepID=A0A2G9FWT1_9LAMI|nr:hypothetical protein CDL12_30010 [Handroanthus impetiginosus]